MITMPMFSPLQQAALVAVAAVVPGVLVLELLGKATAVMVVAVVAVVEVAEQVEAQAKTVGLGSPTRYLVLAPTMGVVVVAVVGIMARGEQVVVVAEVEVLVVVLILVIHVAVMA